VPKVKKVGRGASGRNVKAGKQKGTSVARKRATKRGGAKNVKTMAKRSPAKTTQLELLPTRKSGAGAKLVVGKGSAGKTLSTAKKLLAAKKLASSKVKAPVVRIVVKPLDPQQKCGVGTSVQALYRVDETVDGRMTHHLVFLDRHGWYCEHGRTCPAVGHAKKHDGQIARVS
jgi:hypothetical protein